MKRFLSVLFLMTAIPYVTTLGRTGRLDAGDFAAYSEGFVKDGERTVIVERNGKEISVSAENFLISVLAAQIPADYGEETLKAQAVLARTYIYREMGDNREIREESLDLDALSRTQMEKLWGEKDFGTNYERLKTAVSETAGQAIVCDGRYIVPFFCAASAGKTRTLGEEYPYLKQADSPGDLEAENFLTSSLWTAGRLADRLNQIPDGIAVSSSALPGEIQIVERDGAGYVQKIQIGQKTYSGEEVQYALGLPSSCYSFDEVDGKIRISCKGAGHGYGFSQAGANVLEREGNDYRRLLEYYFQNIEIKTE